MSDQVIVYPQSIRELCGIDTVIFTYSREIAQKLRSLMNNDYQIIHHNLLISDTDELEWVQDALYHSHVFIVTDSKIPFVEGYALCYATEQNPELVIGINLDTRITNFLSAVTKNGVVMVNNVQEIADFIEAQ